MKSSKDNPDFKSNQSNLTESTTPRASIDSPLTSEDPSPVKSIKNFFRNTTSAYSIGSISEEPELRKGQPKKSSFVSLGQDLSPIRSLNLLRPKFTRSKSSVDEVAEVAPKPTTVDDFADTSSDEEYEDEDLEQIQDIEELDVQRLSPMTVTAEKTIERQSEITTPTHQLFIFKEEFDEPNTLLNPSLGSSSNAQLPLQQQRSGSSKTIDSASSVANILRPRPPIQRFHSGTSQHPSIDVALANAGDTPNRDSLVSSIDSHANSGSSSATLAKFRISGDKIQRIRDRKSKVTSLTSESRLSTSSVEEAKYPDPDLSNTNTPRKPPTSSSNSNSNSDNSAKKDPLDLSRDALSPISLGSPRAIEEEEPFDHTDLPVTVNLPVKLPAVPSRSPSLKIHPSHAPIYTQTPTQSNFPQSAPRKSPTQPVSDETLQTPIQSTPNQAPIEGLSRSAKSASLIYPESEPTLPFPSRGATPILSVPPVPKPPVEERPSNLSAANAANKPRLPPVTARNLSGNTVNRPEVRFSAETVLEKHRLSLINPDETIDPLRTTSMSSGELLNRLENFNRYSNVSHSSNLRFSYEDSLRSNMDNFTAGLDSSTELPIMLYKVQDKDYDEGQQRWSVYERRQLDQSHLLAAQSAIIEKQSLSGQNKDGGSSGSDSDTPYQTHRIIGAQRFLQNESSTTFKTAHTHMISQEFPVAPLEIRGEIKDALPFALPAHRISPEETQQNSPHNSPPNSDRRFPLPSRPPTAALPSAMDHFHHIDEFRRDRPRSVQQQQSHQTLSLPAQTYVTTIHPVGNKRLITPEEVEVGDPLDLNNLEKQIRRNAMKSELPPDDGVDHKVYSTLSFISMMVLGLLVPPVYFLIALGVFDLTKGSNQQYYSGLRYYVRQQDGRILVKRYTRTQKIISFVLGVVWFSIVVSMIGVGIGLGLRLS